MSLDFEMPENCKEAVKDYKAKYEQRGYIVNAVFSENKDINEDLIKQNKSTKRAR